MNSTKKSGKGTDAAGVTDDIHNRRLGEMLAAVISNPHVTTATKNVIEAAVVQMCDQASVGVEHPAVLPAAFAAAAADLHPAALRIVRETLLKTLDSNEDEGLIEQLRARGSDHGGQGESDLAGLLSAVMNHPDIPDDLHNHIGDWITSYGEPQVSDPDRIRRALAEVKGRETKQGRAALREVAQ